MFRNARSLFSRKRTSLTKKTRNRRKVESLEPRQLLATFTWDGGGNGISWDDPFNWNADSGFPDDTSDDAIFSANLGNNFTVNVGPRTIGSLTFSNGGGSYVLDSGTLTVDTITQSGGASNELAATVNMTGGTVNVTNGSLRFGSSSNAIDTSTNVNVSGNGELVMLALPGGSLGDAQINLNGGELTVDSVPGEGSTFRVRLPVVHEGV